MISRFVSAAALALAATSAFSADQAVQVDRPWVRATAPGQPASAGYMTLTAKDGAKLVGVATPVAAMSEVHEMKMDGDIMKMRPVSALDLPAGQPVELKPGGYHLMLMELKAPLAMDSTVPITLVFKDASGKEFRQDASLPVLSSAPAR